MGLFSQTTSSSFPWIKLETMEAWKELLASKQSALVFKHSTRCSISSFALKNFERAFEPIEGVELYLLDLIAFRPISNQIAEDTTIEHQSPQLLVLKDGEVQYNASHQAIDAQTIQHLFASI